MRASSERRSHEISHLHGGTDHARRRRAWAAVPQRPRKRPPSRRRHGAARRADPRGSHFTARTFRRPRIAITPPRSSSSSRCARWRRRSPKACAIPSGPSAARCPAASSACARATRWSFTSRTIPTTRCRTTSTCTASSGRAAAPRRASPRPGMSRNSRSRRCTRASTSITAPPRRSACTSPTACTA